jgi:hypothetical protein
VRGRDDRQRAARLKRRGRALEADGRLDPVERRRGEDRAERLGRRRPVLERGVDDLDVREGRELAPRDGGQPRAELDRDDRVAALRERDRRLAGAGADLEDAVARLQAGQPGEVVEELGRVVRPSAVVALGILVEGAAPAQRAVQPRSIVTGVPVNDRPPGPSRNATTSATSSGSISRFTACGATMTSSRTRSSGRPCAFA